MRTWDHYVVVIELSFLSPLFRAHLTTSCSVFLRDCQGCVVAAACGQLRTRDCSKMDLLLLCQTQPVIEASSRMRIGCLQASYPELLGERGGRGAVLRVWFYS